MTEFVEMVKEAYHRDQPLTTQRLLTHVPDDNGSLAPSYFVHHIVPIHDSENVVSGVIIYTENVTERDVRESESSESESSESA
jgi:hypothetical protein